jgi:hypothetical protein
MSSEQRYRNDSSQAERRAILKQDREASSYAAHAQNAVDLNPGGRFAASKAAVVGKAPVPQYPTIPSGPWSAPDPSGLEPSLGYSVDQLEASTIPDPEPSSILIRAYPPNTSERGFKRRV